MYAISAVPLPLSLFLSHFLCHLLFVTFPSSNSSIPAPSGLRDPQKSMTWRPILSPTVSSMNWMPQAKVSEWAFYTTLFISITPYWSSRLIALIARLASTTRCSVWNDSPQTSGIVHISACTLSESSLSLHAQTSIFLQRFRHFLRSQNFFQHKNGT